MSNHKNIFVRCRAIILHEGKLLVIKHREELDYYAFPGGHLEQGESVKECIVREVIEELGVKPEIGRLLYIQDFENSKGEHSTEFFFEVLNGKDYIGCEQNVRSHAHEICEITWLDKSTEARILPEAIGNSFKKGEILSNELRFVKNFL